MACVERVNLRIRGMRPAAAILLLGCGLAASRPAPGEWDGVTASARLDGPYEDPAQANVPFGIISYYNQPWRAYMDTWPAARFLRSMGTQWNLQAKYLEPLCQLWQETGLSSVRYEIGWGNIGWDDELLPHVQANMQRDFAVLKRHGIRPLVLLNAHHGVPCPVRDIQVVVTADADQGDRVLKLQQTDAVRPGYTGIQHPAYIANYPTITGIDADGSVNLSAGLPFAVKAGPLRLVQLKYQPFQPPTLADGTPVPASQETYDGWLKYVATVARTARTALDTAAEADAGFDLEVWNEQTFGSNFLRRNNYFDEKIAYGPAFTYTHSRAMQPSYRPDARLRFEAAACYAILPMTIDYVADPANQLPGVRVISGFANQWPWDNGTGLWDQQAGFSRHYYTGGWRDCTPETPLSQRNTGTIDALGRFDGKKDGKDWHTIEPGSNFVPTFRCGFPEFMHSGFKTEMLCRDLTPDSRWAYMTGHGRYTHNGDFRPAQVWQTEVNYDRNAFVEMLCAEAGTDRQDPRLLPVAFRLAGKTLLRQYIFHAAKGLERIYIFSPQPDPFGIGTLPKAFYAALDANNLELTPEVRQHIPPEFIGLSWLARQLTGSAPITVPRPLRVDALVEYQPRLLFAGDGTAAHPDRWHRDQFAFLPFQVDAGKFVIPYYVVTVDMSRAWDPARDPLDPRRYDMPAQEFAVTIGNLAGQGAEVSVYDPLDNTEVPVEVTAATSVALTVRLATVDYPRLLVVTEAAPGPTILDPQVVVHADGRLGVAWHTNIAVAAEITYGRDWQNRSAQVVALAAGQTAYETAIATGIAGVNAVRIRVRANGLESVWPRWDEDPAGQVVVPAAAPVAVAEAAVAPVTVAEPVPLSAPVDVVLPRVEMNAVRGYSLRLPATVILAGPADNRQGPLGAARLRIRFEPRGAKEPQALLPFVAVGELNRQQAVRLPGGLAATLIELHLQAVAHPGMTNLRQRYLVVPLGDDALVVSVSGAADAVETQAQEMQAIFASIRRLADRPNRH